MGKQEEELQDEGRIRIHTERGGPLNPDTTLGALQAMFEQYVTTNRYEPMSMLTATYVPGVGWSAVLDVRDPAV